MHPTDLRLRIRETTSGFYVIEEFDPNYREWCECKDAIRCLTLWGARIVARRIRKRREHALYSEEA